MSRQVLAFAFTSLVTACATQMPVPPRLRPVDLGSEGSAPITFTRLIIRIPAGTELGHHHDGLLKVGRYAHVWQANLTVASDEYKVIASEELRRHGYRVMGGDNLLFGSDESAKAEYQLGGTLTQLRYDTFAPLAGNYSEASVGVEWQVYDALRRQIVFSRFTEGYEKLPGQESAVIQGAFRSALTNLMASSEFVALVQRRPSSQLPASIDSSHLLLIARCGDTSRVLPRDLQDAFDAVIVIHAGGTLGSGAIVSQDGYALTAAHVVSGLSQVVVSLHSGLELTADVVSVDEPQDVALIKIAGRGYRCLPVANNRSVPLGTDLYAIGAPGGEELAFSVTKGIVSGHRAWNGFSYLQTDAGLNPGNSGGPLLTSDGRLVAIVSWKISGPGFEGLSFGVPLDALTQRLPLRWQ